MLLDANVFLEAALAQKHGPACKSFLEKLRDGKIQAVVTDFHVDSVVLVMESRGKGWKELSYFLASLRAYKGLRILVLGLDERIKATTIMRDYKLDFDDALAVQALRELSLDTIVSYDAHFDAVDWVQRKTPEDLVSPRV